MYFVNTEYQLAALFTKALDEKRFNFLVEKLGVKFFNAVSFHSRNHQGSSSMLFFNVHLRNHQDDQVVNQSQALTSNAVSFLKNRFEKFVLIKKPNNRYPIPNVNSFPKGAANLFEVLRNHQIYYALTTHVKLPKTYLTQFLLSAYVCDLDESGFSIVGYTSDQKGKKMVLLQMNVSNLSNALHLIKHDEYDASPSDEELIEFLKFLSYTPDDDKPLIKRRGKRKGLPPLWNTLFSIINTYLNSKVGSPDQTSQAMLSIMYRIYFNLKLDLAALIYDDMVGLIRKKTVSQNVAQKPSKKQKQKR
ncbi:hypothetical protein OSB04_024118 [Centaurea solstitialis]|uniref:Uncharacterized protein n=1 Tax=Centaurea solstitialis TaxID=347529 RepID=A0AA38SYV8_9ASTR|nr:hypothetical protein OSB04_024118 [Centaurea solstitialis]